MQMIQENTSTATDSDQISLTNESFGSKVAQYFRDRLREFRDPKNSLMSEVRAAFPLHHDPLASTDPIVSLKIYDDRPGNSAGAEAQVINKRWRTPAERWNDAKSVAAKEQKLPRWKEYAEQRWHGVPAITKRYREALKILSAVKHFIRGSIAYTEEAGQSAPLVLSQPYTEPASATANGTSTIANSESNAVQLQQLLAAEPLISANCIQKCTKVLADGYATGWDRGDSQNTGTLNQSGDLSRTSIYERDLTYLPVEIKGIITDIALYISTQASIAKCTTPLANMRSLGLTDPYVEEGLKNFMHLLQDITLTDVKSRLSANVPDFLLTEDMLGALKSQLTGILDKHEHLIFEAVDAVGHANFAIAPNLTQQNSAVKVNAADVQASSVFDNAGADKILSALESERIFAEKEPNFTTVVQTLEDHLGELVKLYNIKSLEEQDFSKLDKFFEVVQRLSFSSHELYILVPCLRMKLTDSPFITQKRAEEYLSLLKPTKANYNRPAIVADSDPAQERAPAVMIVAATVLADPPKTAAQPTEAVIASFEIFCEEFISANIGNPRLFKDFKPLRTFEAQLDELGIDGSEKEAVLSALSAQLKIQVESSGLPAPVQSLVFLQNRVSV
jgi:hypothetical protein